MCNVAYVRVSTSDQDLRKQKLEVFSYAQKRGEMIDRFIESTASSKRSQKERGITTLMDEAESGNVTTLFVPELSRMGRSISEIVRLVERLVEKK